MKSWGLDYDNIKKIKPDIIMASLQGLGQTGPHRDYLTWGPNLMPLMGMTYEWGFPDTPRPIESWTITLTPQEVMRILQETGIAAGPVYNASGVLRDPHLNARDFFVNLEHPDIGTVTHPNVPMKFSKTPGALRMPIPKLGEHNEYVFRELLGLSKEEIRQLKGDEVIV